MFSSEAFWRTMPYQAAPESSISRTSTRPGASSSFGPIRSFLSMSFPCDGALLLVDARFEHDVVDPQDVGGLGLDLAAGGILVLVIDPALALRLRQLDDLAPVFF